MPEGFVYREEVLSAEEERHFVERLALLPFAAFRIPRLPGPTPGRLVRLALRLCGTADPSIGAVARVPSAVARTRGAVAGLAPESLQQVLVTEYAPGAPIGWHRDKPVFQDVVAISFLAPCLLRFRRRLRDGWERRSLDVMPRSAYVLRGAARTEWEHSIPPLSALRYSVTFRNLRDS